MVGLLSLLTMDPPDGRFAAVASMTWDATRAGLVRRAWQCLRMHTRCAMTCQTRRSRRASARWGGRERPAPDELDGERAATGRRGIARQRRSGRAAGRRPPVRSSPRGCLTVVRLNASQPAISMSSKPTTERSSGTRDPDAASRVERAEGDEVVGREDRRRPRSRREQVEAPLVAAVVAELPDTAERLVEGHAGRLEALAEAHALDRGSSSRSPVRR